MKFFYWTHNFYNNDYEILECKKPLLFPPINQFLIVILMIRKYDSAYGQTIDFKIFFKYSIFKNDTFFLIKED